MIRYLISVIRKKYDMFCSFVQTSIDLVYSGLSNNRSYMIEPIIEYDLSEHFIKNRIIFMDDHEGKTIIDMIVEKISDCFEGKKRCQSKLSEKLTQINSLIKRDNFQDALPIPPNLCFKGKMNCFEVAFAF